MHLSFAFLTHPVSQKASILTISVYKFNFLQIEALEVMSEVMSPCRIYISVFDINVQFFISLNNTAIISVSSLAKKIIHKVA